MCLSIILRVFNPNIIIALHNIKNKIKSTTLFLLLNKVKSIYQIDPCATCDKCHIPPDDVIILNFVVFSPNKSLKAIYGNVGPLINNLLEYTTAQLLASTRDVWPLSKNRTRTNIFLLKTIQTKRGELCIRRMVSYSSYRKLN